MSFVAGLLLPLAAAGGDVPWWPSAVIDGRSGIELFVRTCWRGVRDEDALVKTIDRSENPFTETQTQFATMFRNDQAEIQYRMGSYCRVRFRVEDLNRASGLPTQISARLGLADARRWETADIDPAPAIWGWPILPPGQGELHLWLQVEGRPYKEADGTARVTICVVEGGGRC